MKAIFFLLLFILSIFPVLVWHLHPALLLNRLGFGLALRLLSLGLPLVSPADEEHELGVSPEGRALSLLMELNPLGMRHMIDWHGEGLSARNVARIRETLDLTSELVPLDPALRVRVEYTAGGLRLFSLPDLEDDGANFTILYLHGGGYIAGSFRSHGGLVHEIARRCGARVLFPEYRLAPEHPQPAAVDDALLAFRHLLEINGEKAENIVLMGDSAGGGLALLLALRLQREGLPSPLALVTLSAWTDLTGGVASRLERRAVEVMLCPDLLALVAAAVCPKPLELRDFERCSPLHAPREALRALPPMLMQVGRREVLLDDTLELAEKRKERVVVEEYAGLGHVFHFFYEHVEEADKALDSIRNFIRTLKDKKI